MSIILECEHLTKVFENVRAINDLSLTLESGKIIGLLGPNGSGKTTLIKLLNGLLVPTSGRILVDGKKPGAETKSVVSYLPDRNYLNDYMSVEQIVSMFNDFYGDFDPKTAFGFLGKLGIQKETRLKTLSKGNQEKVCLILAMSRKAKLYVLDEPIGGVDPATRDYVISTILQSFNPESTVLISTHLIADIEAVLDEVVFIQDGRLLLQRDVDDIRTEEQKSVDALFREVFRW